MALDEPKDTDNVYDVNGFQFIMEKEFDEKAQAVKVDFLGYGFQISSDMDFGAGAGAGASAGGCAGCGSGSDGCG